MPIRPCLLFCLAMLASAASQAMPNGEDLYQQNCAVCHGDKAQGKVGPKLAGDSSKWSKKLFERAVLKGIDDGGKPLKSPMPHWNKSSLKEDNGQPPTTEEIDAIQQYIRKLH
ncbi:c-type cytochrome [Paludibacterium purpuratum]|uniref:Mono/diheme cytochrome c family protein n=1 Tax=Paludibacterium purpuratum TaxID=1144873 RepID=A0A4R7B2B6_9NEIS|nr:cytochrome c [Paludibacterium purpuratum]TDR77882.1 mono/diheme cytochrome c family protein [Paludibacterium purpuratum]